MTETNALAVATDAAPSDAETLNQQPSPETPSTAQPVETKEGAEPTEVETGDERKPPAEGKKPNAASERFRQIIKERNETEVALFAEKQKAKAAELEVRRLRTLLNKNDLTDVQRQVIELRAEEKLQEFEGAKGAVQEKATEAKSMRLDLFTEKVGQDVADRFCRLPRVSEELADLVAESDFAKELATKFVGDPGEAKRLSALPPHRVGAEIARMEMALKAQPTVRKVSEAPEPSPTLKGGSSPAAFNPTSASTDSYAAMLKKAGVIR